LIKVSDLDPEVALRLYEDMYLIRRTEERLAELYPQEKMRCPMHLSIGQEAVAVGACAHLRADDHVWSTHRCHAHYLAKGGDLRGLIHELHGLPTGCAGGVGGSMHLIDERCGFMGTSAIVGSSMALAVGSALAFQLRGEDRVSVAFVGDSGPETGVFWESLNFAALRQLPLVVVIENNWFSTETPIERRQPNKEFWNRGTSLGIPGVAVPGYSVMRVMEEAKVAINKARVNQGPSIIQADVWRYREHVGPGEDYDRGFRTREELEGWSERDPLRVYRALLEHLSPPADIPVALVSEKLARAERITEERITAAIPEGVYA
jgi:TPP-dependent pyruvate/acetoin dehydrogenase alpha subunit